MTTTTHQVPVRAGVFQTVAQADEAVRRLLAAGFHKDQLAVVCSDETKAELFQDIRTPKPAGSHTPAGVITGGAIGLAAGGLAALLTGIPAIIAAGAMGPFVGAMMTRGAEKEISNFYDQAVEPGTILVAVELHKTDSSRLADAESILAEAGAQPVSLAKG